MQLKLHNNRGFGLIELTMLIVIIGVLAAVAMQSAKVMVQDARRVGTEREMEMLAHSVTGDPSIVSNGGRADFGYVGDVGSFPPDLQALYENPGGYSTWDGPYLPPGFSEDAVGYKTDEWGVLYAYTGGVTIQSSGGGSTLTHRIADQVSDYTLNSLDGTIKDADDSLPGVVYMDSIDITVTMPNGSGGATTKSYTPDAAGSFSLDSLPVGTHPLKLIYTPNVDTLLRYVTILPRHKSPVSFKFASAYFTGGGGALDTIDIRVSGINDDAEEDAGGGMSRNNDKIELGQMKFVGLRFQAIVIPQGATISAAWVEFKAADGNTENTDLMIWGEDINNATQFSNGNSNISNRTKTSASVLWNNVESWSNNQTYNTPEIANLIQEIVDRAGWSSGSDLVIVFESTDPNGKRLFDAYDFSSTDAGLLHVEFE